MKELFRKRLEESARVKHELADRHLAALLEIAEAARACLKRGRTLYLCGNGGSAADAQHIAAELTGRFKKERKGLPAVALTTDSSALTAIGNDYGFERIFERQVEALVGKGDVLLAISTSGNSPNVLRAARKAKALGATTIGLTGRSGGKLKRIADHCLCVPSDETPHIQEAHITIGHLLCEFLETR
jgi:D-sedoheptulose 7-phosphate isomerase